MKKIINISKSLDNLRLYISKKEFKSLFLKIIVFYVVIELLGFFFTGAVGTFGGFVPFVLIILFGRSLYKNRQNLHAGAIKVFWYFIIAHLIVFLIVFQFLLLILNPILVTALFIPFNMLFWIYFLIFWSKEENLPLKSIVYISAIALHATFLGLLGLVFLFLEFSLL